MILRRGRHMPGLIDGLLDVSRIRRGTLPTSKLPVQVEEAVDEAVEAVRSLIDAHGHELTMALPSEPLWLEADPVRMEQILVNLAPKAVATAGGTLPDPSRSRDITLVAFHP